MLTVFYCFAHPERGNARALINGWKRWAGCCCSFSGCSDPQGWSLGIPFSSGLFLLLLCPVLILNSVGTWNDIWNLPRILS